MKFAVFLSYAHLDNWTALPDEAGWVDVFKQCLERRLQAEFAKRQVPHSCEVWIDKAMNRNWHFEDRIEHALTKADALVALLSHDYLQSRWCGKEGKQFLTDLVDKYPAGHSGREGIFVVDCDNSWDSAQGDNDTAALVRKLRQSIAGTYGFYSLGDRGPQRICEPVYVATHSQAKQFIAELSRLAKELADHLCQKAAATASVSVQGINAPISLALVPPPRNKNSSCWRDYSNLWKSLAEEESLALLPVFGGPFERDLSRIAQLPPNEYARLRLNFLADLPKSGMLVQVLSENASHWDDSVVRCWTQAKQSACLGGISWHYHVSQLDRDARHEVVQTAPGITDKNAAAVMQDHECCELYSSVEDLARTIVDKAVELRRAARNTASQNRWEPVLIETCQEDQVLLQLLRRELERLSIPFTNRRGFVENNTLPDLSKLTFNSIMYICKSAARHNVLYLADQNKTSIVGPSKAIPCAVIYWTPPHTEGFAKGSSYLFDHDIPISAEATEESASLQRGMEDFKTWVRNRTSPQQSQQGAQ